jgi:hypothetical protein
MPGASAGYRLASVVNPDGENSYQYAVSTVALIEVAVFHVPSNPSPPCVYFGASRRCYQVAEV